ncbi:MAG: hypothetical protein RLY14_2251 [Planctomycetota bacterium]|jgi:multidrug efflux pump subunit AcrA (membrane-fusion protein)
MNKHLRDKVIAVSILILAIVAAWWNNWLPTSLLHSQASNQAIQEHAAIGLHGDASILRLQTIHPRRDNQIEITVTQPAEVNPYYQVQLFAETAGTVTMIEKDIGDEVSQGETVAEVRPAGAEKPVAIVSPIDGVIVSRSVDPGTFVPNAGLIPGAIPLVSIAKLDIVTISMNVPDMYAPYVVTGMNAWIRNPNATKTPWLQTKLTRVSPIVKSGDRTRQVQVDLFNDTKMEFDEMRAEASQNDFEAFKSRQAPEFPVNLSGNQRAELTPGLVYEMRIVMDQFARLPLLPSAVIVRKSGKASVFVIEKGKLEQVPVVVQFDDGTYTYARPVIKDEKGNLQEGEWVGNEEIVLPNASDLQIGKIASGELQAW